MSPVQGMHVIKLSPYQVRSMPEAQGAEGQLGKLVG
jgi:hypothetical protein